MKPQKYWTLVYEDKGVRPYFLDRIDIVDDDMSMMEVASFVPLFDTKSDAQAALEELDRGSYECNHNAMPAPVEVEVKIDSDGKPVMTITMPISEALHKKLKLIKSSL